MEWIGEYELMAQVGETPAWQWFIVQKVSDGSPYRTAPERFLLRRLRHKPEDEFEHVMLDDASMATLVTHVNVESAYALLENARAWVTELIEGWSLSSIISASDNRQLPIEAACFIVHELCLGLHHIYFEAFFKDDRPLHMLHRSIGPAEVLLAQDGTVKLTNPSLNHLRMLDEDRPRGELCWTAEKVSRLSPEQAMGHYVDHGSDLYQLGFLLYELVTGELGFRCDNPIDMIRAIRDIFVPPPSSLRPEIPKILDAVILRALAKDPDDRQPTARELAWNLELVMQALGCQDGRAVLLQHIERTGLEAQVCAGGL